MRAAVPARAEVLAQAAHAQAAAVDGRSAAAADGRIAAARARTVVRADRAAASISRAILCAAAVRLRLDRHAQGAAV